MVSLKTIEEYFKNNDPGGEPFKLDICSTITNPREFVKKSIEGLNSKKRPDEKRALMPYYNRLLKFYNLKIK